MGKKRKNVSPIPKSQRKAHYDVQTLRRERVATLRNRMLTEREIYVSMSTPGTPFFMVNPQTQKPYSAGTIHNDLAYLREQRLATASTEYDEWFGEQLAEIREARKAFGWAKNDWKAIAKFMELEMRLTGTMDAGSVTFNQFNQQNNLFMNEDGTPKTVNDMSDEELMLIASQGLPETVEGEIVDDESD